jgi:hypothetical protein
MWLLSNATPFCAERTWVRDQDGAEVWVVAIRGSFLVRDDGRVVLDPEQSEVLRVPKFRGPPEASSLLYDADLVHTKRRTDVLVDGHAMAPGRKAVSSIDVRLKVAGIDKTLRIHGDRVIGNGVAGISLSRPELFTEMPLIWERSFGGTDKLDADPDHHDWDTRNPVGRGFATRVGHVLGTLAPNVEDPRAPYRSPKRGTPAGFAPVARHWMPRARFAGTYDKRWEDTRRPLLPSDFDEGFYQCAPEDQQIDGYLKGGEAVQLYNLSPEGYLGFVVPRVFLVLTTRFYDGTEVEHRPVIHTLVVQPGRRRLEIVWHSALPCHHRVNKLAITQIIMKRRVNPQREVQLGILTGA